MSGQKKTNRSKHEDVVQHYSSGYEANRLKSGNGLLEYERTCQLLKNFLPKAPATILDVGGGPGGYALWLARLGYAVHLLDIVPIHIEQALEESRIQLDAPLASAKVGDARNLSWNDNSVNAVLLFGPLYHLTEKEDRIQALNEAYRVLRPKGLLMAVGISRFASTFDGLRTGYLKDPVFMDIVKQDLKDGQHRNEERKPGYFTDTFFHHPDELRDEVTQAGFTVQELLGIEGPSWLALDFESWWEDAAIRQMLLSIAKTVESEPSMIGASAHLMAVAHKK